MMSGVISGMVVAEILVDACEEALDVQEKRSRISAQCRARKKTRVNCGSNGKIPRQSRGLCSSWKGRWM